MNEDAWVFLEQCKRWLKLPAAFFAFVEKLFGVFVLSEMTAAAAGKIGALRHDPFAMLPAMVSVKIDHVRSSRLAFGETKGHQICTLYARSMYGPQCNTKNNFCKTQGEIESADEIKAKYKYWRIRIFYSIYVGYALFYFTRKSFTFKDENERFEGTLFLLQLLI